VGEWFPRSRTHGRDRPGAPGCASPAGVHCESRPAITCAGCTISGGCGIVLPRLCVRRVRIGSGLSRGPVTPSCTFSMRRMTPPHVPFSLGRKLRMQHGGVRCDHGDAVQGKRVDRTLRPYSRHRDVRRVPESILRWTSRVSPDTRGALNDFRQTKVAVGHRDTGVDQPTSVHDLRLRR
jgi:hypothetical protein